MQRISRGFSLLEVVVSLLLAGLMLLGLAATQLKSLQFASNSFHYTMALIHGQNAIDRMWPILCQLQHQNSSLDSANNPLVASLNPDDPNFSLQLPAAFSQEMQITVSWADERMTNPAENQISLLASFPAVADDCTSGGS